MELRLLSTINEHLKMVPNKSSRGEQTMNIVNGPIPEKKERREGMKYLKRLTPLSPSHSGMRDKMVGVNFKPLNQSAQRSPHLSPERPSYKAALDKRAQKIKAVEQASKEVLKLEQSNSTLRKNLLKLKQQVKSRTLSLDEKQNLSYKLEEPPRRRLKPLMKTFNFIHHNKQTFYNCQSSTDRPISEVSWTKHMQMSPRQQISAHEEWVDKPKHEIRPSNLDFSKIQGTILVKPSFKYCQSCNDTGQFLILENRSRSINI